MSACFQTLFDHSSAENLPFPQWAQELRQRGKEQFLQVGLPQRTHEEWKYTSLRPLSELRFQPPSALVALTTSRAQAIFAQYAQADDLMIVCINGALATGLSHLNDLPDGVTITTVTDALRQDHAALRASLGRDLQEQGGCSLRPEHGVHAFAALSEAFLRDGVVLDVARGTKVDRTLHIIHLVTPDAHDGPTAYFPRHIIRIGERAEAHVVETFCAVSMTDGQKDAMPYLVSVFTDVMLASNARLTHLRVQAEGASGMHVGLARAAVERDAYFGTFSFAAGGRLARVDLDVTLRASGAEVDLDGLYLVHGSQHVDHHTVVEHRVANATSRQLYKGILGDTARGVFNGKVLVREGAHGTNAFQLNQNLLLSSDAEVDTKPELQIDADDVKCSHGAAIGQLNADQMFYLQSRGLTAQEAEKLLCAAFADDVLLKVKTPGRLDILKQLALDYVTP